MSEGITQPELHEASQDLLQGPLKHVKAAALAAALVPLASVMATPASAQAMCGSGGICGFVWYDTDNNGIQDAGELGVEFVKVYHHGRHRYVEVETDSLGFYYFLNFPNGTYTIYAAVPPGTQASPAKVGLDDTIDSDGVPDGMGKSVASDVVVEGLHHTTTDFGLFKPPVEEPPPGTGTPGFWKNHPEAWPVSTITVGGVEYTLDEAFRG